MNLDDSKLTNNPSTLTNPPYNDEIFDDNNQGALARAADANAIYVISDKKEDNRAVGPDELNKISRSQALKREKSLSDSIEKKNKKVKFSISKFLKIDDSGKKSHENVSNSEKSLKRICKKSILKKFSSPSHIPIRNVADDVPKQNILLTPNTIHEVVVPRIFTSQKSFKKIENGLETTSATNCLNRNVDLDKDTMRDEAIDSQLTSKEEKVDISAKENKITDCQSKTESDDTDSKERPDGNAEIASNQPTKRKFKIIRRRNLIVPQLSKLAPNIISRKDRNLSFKFKNKNNKMDADEEDEKTFSVKSIENDDPNELQKEEKQITNNEINKPSENSSIKYFKSKLPSKAKFEVKTSKRSHSSTLNAQVNNNAAHLALNANSKRPCTTPTQPPPSSNDQVISKLHDEVKILKEHKKVFEEKLKEMNARERDFASESRILREKYEIEISKMVKESKKEASQLLSELRSKERVVYNLQKSLHKQNSELQELKKLEQAVINKENVSQSFSIPRPSLARSVSAAASIGRRIRHPNSKEKKLNKDSTKKQKDDTPQGQGSDGTTPEKGQKGEKRKETNKTTFKIEQLKNTIKNQEEEIIFLQEKLKLQNPNLQSFSQLSASVPSLFEDQSQNEFIFCPKSHNESSSFCSTNAPLYPAQQETLIRQKELENYDTMSTLEEQNRSLDFLEARFNSIGPSAMSLGYSSLASTNVNSREQDLADENEMLRAELQEARDHSELLEFRILEFTEGIQKATGAGTHPTRDQSTCTNSDDHHRISISSSQLSNDDLSLPMSLDSGLELNLDCNTKGRLQEYRKSLVRLEEASDYSETLSVAHLNLLLDWAESVSTIHYETLPPIMSPRSPTHKKMDLSMDVGEHMLDGSDLNLLAARLQESLANPKEQEEVLQETIVKLRAVNASLCRLQSRVGSLTTENKDLQEALATLHEAHETRTEASGTESELVHGKTPSLHSDLSDAESDESPRNSHSKSRIIDSSTSFQESGIFESSCDLVTAATQTSQTTTISDYLHQSNNKHETGLRGTNLTKSHNDNPSEPDMEKSEVDLQTALARLSSIRSVVQGNKDFRNLRLQDLQESDEYLVAALEGETVILTKLEYDALVATERALQREIEILQYEKDQLSEQCLNLDEQLQEVSKSYHSDAKEVLRAEHRLLLERLEVSERLKRQFYDEKCEMEEAENDARLLAQRLESQLEAAREMESLLSASLSQEQEFCRELQRRVREMHAIDKGRRMHEEVLAKESQSCKRREAAIIEANDTLQSQLYFGLYSLILVEFWRRLASFNRYAIVPYNPKNVAYIDCEYIKQFGNNWLCEPSPLNLCISSGNKSCDTCSSGQLQSTTLISLSDCSTQTLSKHLRDGAAQTAPTACNNVEVQCTISQVEKDLVELESEPLRKRLRSADMSKLLTSAVEAEALSEREQYYLAQIEALQKERKCLRENFESTQSGSLNQLQNTEAEIEELRQKLEDTQRDKRKLLFKLEESQSAIIEAESEFQRQIKELKKDFNRSVESYLNEQQKLQQKYEDKLAEMYRTSEAHEQRFTALLQQYSILQHELEPFIHKNTDSSGDELESSHSSGRISTTKDLLIAVRELIRSESHVRQKLNELEKKESAFRETINEADRIMSNHVTLYTRRIEELEAAVEQKSSRIQQLENSEERLRVTMKNSWKSGEGPRITDLLDRLLETENSELQLKERVWNLERNGKELQIKIVEAEKAQEQLRGELKDQEEIVQRLMALTSENNALTSQLQEAHAAVKRASDIQQSENYLKNRVDELEASEGNLRDTLKQTEQMIMHRERKARDQIMYFEEEISTLRGQLDLRMSEVHQSKEAETSLKQQVEYFRSQILSLEKELKDSSSENICHETQHRSEVTKLRTQLKVVNSQLTDLDSLNGELKERLDAAELAMKEVATQLEERSRRHESEVLSLNLDLSQKDLKLEEYEIQIQQLAHAHVVSELDYLATSPLVQIQTSLETFIQDSKACQECTTRNKCHLESLMESLKSLTEVINGRNSQSDSDSEDSESGSAKNLVTELSQTTFPSPPTPAQEGHQGNSSSGDEEVISVASLPITNNLVMESNNKRTVVKSKSSELIPSVPPRVKRDAMKKRKVRKPVHKGSLLQELENETSLEGGSFYGRCPPSITILEELEEKVKELEEVVTRKEKELRLADLEAADFHTRLQEEDEKLLQKNEEVQQSNAALASLREQLLVTVQEYERVRQVLEAKHKADTSALSAEVKRLTEDLLRVTEKSIIKDKIIDTLVKQIRAILRSGNMGVVINQLRHLTSNEVVPKDGNEENTVPDFDVEKVCQMVNAPWDVASLQPTSQPTSPSTDEEQPDLLGYKSLPNFASSTGKVDHPLRSTESQDPGATPKSILSVRSAGKACPSARNLPPLLENKKSRIPRLRPLSVPPLKHDCLFEQRDFEDFSCSRSLNRLYKRSNTAVAKPAGEIKQELKPLAKVVPKQRPMAKVSPKPKVLLSSSLHSLDKKVPSSEESQNKFISDARKIKRMVTGLTPMDAEVDCSSAPEFHKQPRPPTPTCVPRPTNLKITRRVGLDGAVIAWAPLEHDCVAGFQVIVGGRVVQTVRSPHRTKALVTGLPFPCNFTIGLVAISDDGRCSTPTLVTHEKSQIYNPKLLRSSSLGDTRLLFASPRRAVPTCL